MHEMGSGDGSYRAGESKGIPPREGYVYRM
jgi:hypothetical protein